MQTPIRRHLELPRFEHHCVECSCIAHLRIRDTEFDLYYCRAHGVVTARYGNSEGEYFRDDPVAVGIRQPDMHPALKVGRVLAAAFQPHLKQ